MFTGVLTNILKKIFKLIITIILPRINHNDYNDYTSRLSRFPDVMKNFSLFRDFLFDIWGRMCYTLNMDNRINYIDETSGRKPTEKQLEVLLLLNPFVKKTNYAEVAKTLGISRAAVQQRICHLKKRCPSIYKKFWDLKKAMNDRDHKRRLNNPIPISQLCIDNEQNECFDYIKTKETF